MIANTDSVQPVYLELPPDWGQGVEVVQAWKTSVVKARDDAEQRFRRRLRPTYSLSFVAHPTAGSAFARRRVAALLELGAPVVVPLWTHGQGFLVASGDDVTLNVADLSRQPFRPGGYAYFQQDGLASVFRLVEAVEDNVLTLEAGNAAYPDVAVPSYTPAATVYPCLTGMRVDNRAGFELDTVDETRERVEVMEL